jgi:sRNA-binding protein
MRSTSIIALVLLTSAFCFLSATHAGAEKLDNTPSACGTTPAEAIAAAERALADKQPERQTRAVACLLAAVKALEAERLDAVRGNDKARVLRVPRTD